MGIIAYKIVNHKQIKSMFERLSLKSMNIFSTSDYDSAINDSIYSFIISSVLGFTTKDLIGLNIWSGTIFCNITVISKSISIQAFFIKSFA